MSLMFKLIMLAVTINYIAEEIVHGLDFGLTLNDFGVDLPGLQIIPNRILDVGHSKKRVYVTRFDVDLLSNGSIGLKKMKTKSKLEKAPNLKETDDKDDGYLDFLKYDPTIDQVFSLFVVIDTKKTPAGYLHKLPKLKLENCSESILRNPLKNLHGIEIGSLLSSRHAFIIGHDEFVFLKSTENKSSLKITNYNGVLHLDYERP